MSPSFERQELVGAIASAAFSTGDRIVVGAWRNGPLGPMNDVMWARPDGRRILMAGDQRVIDYVSTIYDFDETRLVSVFVGWHGRSFVMATEFLRMKLNLSARFPIPLWALRFVPVIEWIESPIARRILGVNVHGVTNSGVEEWYRATAIQWVRSGSATLNGVDLGALKEIEPLKVGVSEPPRRPSVVSIRPLLHDLLGRLNKFVKESE